MGGDAQKERVEPEDGARQLAQLFGINWGASLGSQQQRAGDQQRVEGRRRPAEQIALSDLLSPTTATSTCSSARAEEGSASLARTFGHNYCG